jgi:hypothetical protein
VCNENLIGVDLVKNCITIRAMVALLFLFLNLLATPLRSNSRLEAENAALRHQVVVWAPGPRQSPI